MNPSNSALFVSVEQFLLQRWCQLSLTCNGRNAKLEDTLWKQNLVFLYILLFTPYLHNMYINNITPVPYFPHPVDSAVRHSKVVLYTRPAGRFPRHLHSDALFSRFYLVLHASTPPAVLSSKVGTPFSHAKFSTLCRYTTFWGHVPLPR